MVEYIYVGCADGVWAAHGWNVEFSTFEELESYFKRVFDKRGMAVEFREIVYEEYGVI